MSAPSLRLDFRAGLFDRRLTFARLSSARRWDASGRMVAVPAGQPRLDHDPATGQSLGLLVEAQGTNMATWSEDVSAAVWNASSNNLTVTANARAAPDGTTTADHVAATAANATHRVVQTVVASAGLWTACVFARASARRYLWLRLWDGTSEIGATFDLLGGTVVSAEAGVTASIQAIGGGWWRPAVSRTMASTAASSAVVMYLLSDQLASTWAGDGVGGLHLWGAQVEAGGVATSYIPTAGATATRAADTATLDAAALGRLVGAAGTLYAAGTVSGVQAGGNQFLVSLDDGSISNTIRIWRNNSLGGVGHADVRVGNINTLSLPLAPAIAASAVHRMALAWSADDCAAVANAGTVASVATGPVPAGGTLTLRIGQSRGLEHWQGHVRQVLLWPRRLPSADLIRLTAT